MVLEEGKLEFNDNQKDKPFTMKPNDLVVYNKTLKDFSTEVVQPRKYLSWTEGKLVFRNDPIDVIARRLERWYNIDVEINGNFAENQTKLQAAVNRPAPQHSCAAMKVLKRF